MLTFLFGLDEARRPVLTTATAAGSAHWKRRSNDVFFPAVQYIVQCVQSSVQEPLLVTFVGGPLRRRQETVEKAVEQAGLGPILFFRRWWVDLYRQRNLSDWYVVA